ncbi:MAG: purine-binding chemotaxis protein CheW [Nitrospira sp.]|nr:purine-binding chemotaxis protein CheW [Nitrospira sp.]
MGELPLLHSDSIPEQPKSTDALRVCLIKLGQERFAIDLRQVREVFEPESVTPVPGMPDVLVGVTNLRGTIIPLADVRRALGVSASAMPKYAVVVRHGTHQVGILVEDVPTIRIIHSHDLMAPSAYPTAKRHPMISLLFKTESKPSAILEMSRLLSSIEETATGQSL